MLGIATMKMNFIHIHHDILTPARSGKNKKLGGMTGFPKSHGNSLPKGKVWYDLFSYPRSNPVSKHHTPIASRAHLQ
jgi:hypothetical protein